MSYSVGAHFETYIREQVKSGRFNNASEVVRDALRLHEEREAKLASLRATLDASIARGGSNTDEDVAAHIEAELAALREPA